MRRAGVAWLAMLLAASACDLGATTDLGLHAGLRIAAAQFVTGAMPRDEAGPAVDGASFGIATLPAGITDQILVGALAPGSVAVAIGMEADAGYWLLLADPPESIAPTLPTFHARFTLARALAPGTHRVIVRAADQRGRLGPPRVLSLDVTAVALPEGELVVRLEWDNEADLDLHLVTPSGTEVWSRHPLAYDSPPPPALPDPIAQSNAGRLDVDSNASCVFDGRSVENIVFRNPPPSGHYVVRVDATSLCGTPFSYYRASIHRAGALIDTATGVMSEADTRGAHEQGAGRTVLELDVP